MAKKSAIALSALILLAAAAAMLAAWSWPLKAKLFPMVVGIPLVCLAGVELALSLTSKGVEPAAEIPKDVAFARTLVAFGWIIGFFAAIVLLGFALAVPVFVFLYLKIQGRESALFSAAIAGATWAIFYALFDRLLHLPFPAGWLF